MDKISTDVVITAVLTFAMAHPIYSFAAFVLWLVSEVLKAYFRSALSRRSNPSHDDRTGSRSLGSANPTSSNV